MKQFGSFRLDRTNARLWDGEAQIALPPKPFAVLCHLVDNPGRLITHDELLDTLWPETYVQPQVLRTYMLELRKVLKDDAAQPRFIQTLPKRGYCFVAPVCSDTGTKSAEAGSETQAARESHAEIAVKENPGTAIVGRDEELAELRRQFMQADGGSRQTAFVTGEAGIGKTALVDAFCGQICASPHVTLARGQCVEGIGLREEYYPVMEMLGQLCALPDDGRICKVLARLAPAWLAAVGRDSESGNTKEAQTGLRTTGELCAALEEIAAEKPLVLIFEDLHWADASTLQLISALARRRAPAKLMVVATFRPQERSMASALRELKQDLLMRRLSVEVELAPLSKLAVSALLRRELKQELLPDGLASFVHQHSEGNPLFAIAILEHLIAQGFLVCAAVDGARRWEQHTPFQEMEAGVPAGLAQMIELEMERLSPQEQRILEAGSLMSVAFPAWAVAAALEMNPAETEDACDELSRRLYFVQRAGEDELPDGESSTFYVFTHGLYREVLYHRQSPARRAKRHVRIAERLAEMFRGREATVAREMAVHYESAGHWRQATDALLTAAHHAHVRQAYFEAVQILEHASRIAENLSETERPASAREIDRELMRVREAMHDTAECVQTASQKS